MADVKKTTTTKTTSKKAVEVKTLAQLQEELVTLVAQNLESRRSHKQRELVNPHVLTVQRKNIARAHTAIAQAITSELKEEK